MRLTKQQLYKLIMEQMKAFYQAPRSMKKRLMADPNVDKATAMKLYRMLDSDDEDAIASAEELMAAMGIGEYGEDDEDITVMNTPEIDIEDAEKAQLRRRNFDIEQELELTVKERYRLRQIASAAKNMTHVVQILDNQAEKAKGDFRRILPFLMEPEELPSRGEMNQAMKDALELMEKVIDVFYDKVDLMFPDLEDTNFMVYDSYQDKLSKYLLEYFDDVAKGRKQMEPIEGL